MSSNWGKAVEFCSIHPTFGSFYLEFFFVVQKAEVLIFILVSLSFPTIAAAEELIEHLKSENNQLHNQVNNLRNEVASIRHAFPLSMFFIPLFFSLGYSLNLLLLCFIVKFLLFIHIGVSYMEDSKYVNYVRLAKDKEVADYQRLYMEESKKSETFKSF